MICPLYPDPAYLVITQDVPQLIYYSHFSSIIVAISLGIFVYFSGRKLLLNKLLFLISILFTLWTLLSLITWTNNDSGIISLAWALGGVVWPALCIATLYFYLVFVYKQDISSLLKVIFTVLLSPVILLVSTTINIEKFDLIGCSVIENVTLSYYYYSIGLLCLLWVLHTGIKLYRTADTREGRLVIRGITIGTSLFLFAFFINGFIATYLFDIGLVEDFSIDQYGLFGMTFFMGVLTYLIVKFKAFHGKLFGAQALVGTLWILVGSLLFVAKSDTTKFVSGVTLLITMVAGYNLVKSVKKEIKQREQIEELADHLEKANKRLKELDKMKSEFVSIASHQLRSPITSIRGYASMLVEGSYGKIPEKASEVLSKIVDSAKFMALSIEDYLNVSRIEAGNMKYEMSDFDLKKTAETVVDELRPVALKKGLLLMFKSDVTGSSTVHADIGKTRQVMMNLIDNSIKYTPKGTVTVTAKNDLKKKTMRITITDTGIGMSKETQSEVFDKFVRAKNANSVNVTGTGLGLYVAKIMVAQMKGKVWAESDGEGMGSRFIVEFPLM